MQNSSAFQYLAIDTIHESTTNPRRTFDESKLQELADFVPGHKILFLFPCSFCGRGGRMSHC
jgi:ParB family chromosome partitioning protein